MTYIIYKDLSGYKMTNIDNYFSCIQDVRKISDFSAFDDPASIIEYCDKHFGRSKDDVYKIID